MTWWVKVSRVYVCEAFAQEVPYAGEDVSRKGAKTQSATMFLNAFLAPLREKDSYHRGPQTNLRLFVQSLCETFRIGFAA